MRRDKVGRLIFLWGPQTETSTVALKKRWPPYFVHFQRKKTIKKGVNGAKEKGDGIRPKIHVCFVDGFERGDGCK